MNHSNDWLHWNVALALKRVHIANCRNAEMSQTQGRMLDLRTARLDDATAAGGRQFHEEVALQEKTLCNMDWQN